MIKKTLTLMTLALFAQGVSAEGRIETPKSGTLMSGKALFSGWHCDASKVEIELPDGSKLEAAYGTPRADVTGAGFCDGNENVGYGALYNMNLLGDGEHTIKAYADGVEFATSTFTVTKLSSGNFLSGAEATVSVADFPVAGNSVTLAWEQTLQNFVITGETIPASGTGEVFDNGVVAAQWDGGIKAFDEQFNWNECADGGEACPSLGWELVDDDDRGSVLEVTYTGPGLAAIYFQASDPGVDMSDYATGTLSFDVKVVNAANNTDGWTMKVDCIYPCSSGDQTIGTAGLSGWETVTVPISQLTEGGLNLTSVSTGLVIWPNGGQQQDFVYRIDNVFWYQ